MHFEERYRNAYCCIALRFSLDSTGPRCVKLENDMSPRSEYHSTQSIPKDFTDHAIWPWERSSCLTQLTGLNVPTDDPGRKSAQKMFAFGTLLNHSPVRYTFISERDTYLKRCSQ